MQKIPLVRAGKTFTDNVVLPADQIVRIDRISERKYTVHTADQIYEIDLSLESLEEWLYEDGFRMLDSNNLININHISTFDERKGTVYLGNSHDHGTKTGSVARIQYEHVRKLLRMLRKSATRNDKEEYYEHEEIEMTGIYSKSYESLRYVIERKQMEEKIRFLAYHDTVTHLPNRIKFRERLELAIRQRTDDNRIGAVIFIDLDRFKFINDTLGHASGDELLRAIADRLRYLNSDRVTARFGGDEFLILLPNCSDQEEVTTYVQQIRDQFVEPFHFRGKDYYVSASIGVSLFPKHGNDPDALIQYADTAMFRSKEKGGNQAEWFAGEMNTRLRRRRQIENDMRKALDQDQFYLLYQPLVDIESGRIIGMEALLRWRHPELGILSPLEFISIAEETGMIIPLGLKVLQDACMQTTKWHQDGYTNLTVSVNISAKQFHQPGFLQTVQMVIEQTGLSHEQLCIELTESVAMSQTQLMKDLMSKLHELGVKVAIDDFGTGYSSLAYLKQFRVHAIKFDRSFIQGVATDRDDAAIVETMIRLSRQLNIRTVAEGVETEAQLEFLRINGCKEMQGYLFSKPVNADQFVTLLNDNKGR